MKRDQVFAEYWLFGDFDPDSISLATNVIPSFAAKVGAPVPRTGTPRPFSKWTIRSDLPRTALLTEHVQSVLDRLRPAWQQFVEYGRRYDACVEAVIELYEAQGPEVTFSPAVLVPIAELNATFDFDLYCLGDGREE